MLIEESKRRQEQLKKILLDMASSCMDDKKIREKAINLRTLYTGGFRHSYADFFPLIVDISKEETTYSLDYLSNNLIALRELVESSYIEGEKEFSALYQPLTKLIDHINLEIGRYSYYSISEQRVKDLETKNSVLQNNLLNATNELNLAEKRLSALQTELISVLSIFAAIVLAFAGGLTLLGNSFSNLETVAFFKILFFTLLCGFILFNTIYVLVYLIGKLTGKNISAKCRKSNVSCDDCSTKCLGINKIRLTLPYLFWINAVILALILLDGIVWLLDIYLNIIP